jgi:hypothetical protein
MITAQKPAPADFPPAMRRHRGVQPTGLRPFPVEVAMLEGLDQLDWAARRHAYGPATDVPEWLRSLRSPDPEVRQWAYEDWNIVHQGTRNTEGHGRLNRCYRQQMANLLPQLSRDRLATPMTQALVRR